MSGVVGVPVRAGCLCLMAGWAAIYSPGSAAQQAAPVQQAPAAQPAQEQQPGKDAQVKTGTNSGLNTDVRLQNLLADHQYFRVADELDQLPAEQAQLYRGILANRANDTKKSIALLEPLIETFFQFGDGSRSLVGFHRQIEKKIACLGTAHSGVIKTH